MTWSGCAQRHEQTVGDSSVTLVTRIVVFADKVRSKMIFKRIFRADVFAHCVVKATKIAKYQTFIQIATIEITGTVDVASDDAAGTANGGNARWI